MARLGKSNREKDLVRVACVAPFRDGLLLFGKRGDDGKWNLPGGHLEPGEDPEDGARRELMEESGYGDLRGDLKYIGKGDIPERNLTVYCFRADVPDREPTAENDPDQEMVDWRWVDPDQIPAEILDNLHNKQDVTLQLLGLQQGRFSKAEAGLEKADEQTPEAWYHITDNPRFSLNPEYAPQDNSISIHSREGQKGIYLTEDPERWVNGHNYVRPYVAEFHVPKGLGRQGRWNGEMFVPAAHYNKMRLNRVIPLDAHVREQYNDHGWIESHHGTEFDTGNPIVRRGKPGWQPGLLRGYRYQGPDVRDMSQQQIDQHDTRWRAYMKQNRGIDLDAPSEEDLGKMAIKDLKVGRKLPPDMTLWPEDRLPEYDYSHLLPEETKKQGYGVKLRVLPGFDGKPGLIRAIAYHGGDGVGDLGVELDRKPGALWPRDVHIAPEHRNKGLGTAMYEAAYAHGMKRLKIKEVAGGLHSSLASAVHQKLAARHGLKYTPEPNPLGAIDSRLAPKKVRGDYDQVYGPYRYALKSESDLEKMAQIDQTQNPEFRKWFKGSKIKHPKTGKPLTVYHGTTHDFNSFSHKKGNPENYYGRAHYFTSHPSDVENYASEEGPDLKQRLELETERHPIFEENPAAAKDAARKQLVGPGPRVIPAHLNLKNPVDVRPNGGTMFHIDQDYDTEGEPVGEAKSNGVKLMEAVKAVAPRYHLNPHEILTHIGHSLEHDGTSLWEGASAHQIERALRAHEGIAYADDNEGHNVSNEVIRDIWKAAGHDGVILDAYSAFGPKKDLVHGGYYGGMPGVMPGTNHYIAFSPGQIKGAFNQTFDPRSTAFGKDEAPMAKGAMSRLQPFDPQQDISESAKDKLHAWTVDMTGARSDLPSLPQEAMTRALHKLHAVTSTRRNPQTGEREFLLHRGMGTSEYKESVKDGRVRQPRRYSSWTPHQEVASYWGNLHGAEPFTTVSAWIPESKIHTVPKMAGSTEIPFPEKVPTPGPAHNAHEFEVIVRGHDSEMAHPDQVNPARDLIVKKAESTVIQNWVESLTKDEDLVPDPDDEDMNQAAGVAEDMLGFNPQARPEFEAAQFLAHSSKPAPLSLMRLALYHHEHDLEAAALTSFGLAVDDGNRAALRGVVALRKTPLGKAEAPGTVPAAGDVTPALPDAAGTAAEVQRALAAHRAQPIKLNGRHSSGMIMAKDPQTQTVFLLKPGSGGQSPAKGAEQDPSSQSRREAAFWAVAEAWGLGSYIPRADLIIVDGQEWAAIRMLPFSWENLDKVRAEDPGIATRVLARYRDDGVLHKWAVLDAILGNPDRHAQNLMIDGDRKQIALIDHGSAFAGDEFDPAYDRNSFVPFYLRAWSSKNFNALTVADKLRYMPRVSKPTQEVLRVWLQDLHADRLQAILHRFGIDPRPCLERLAKIKVMASSQPLDQCINRFWVTT